MSNKTLVIVICALIVVSVAAAGYFYWQQTKPLKVTMDDQNNSQQNNPAYNYQQPATSPAPAAKDEASAQCVRNFDSGKLAGNSSISTKNRQVEIDVKNFGKINLEFYPSDAPKAVENFLRLTDSGYYNCLTFHRVSKGFVIQGGDPNGNGTGGESAFGSPFADELNGATASYKAGYVHGVLAMANSGPNTNGSQFFIMLGDVPLSHNYTIFGKVTSGLDIVDKIGQVEINPQMGPTDGAPKVPVVMQSVKIIK